MSPSAGPSGKPSGVFDATAASFQQSVVERSREVPVLVDFWAAWCGPCRTLGPILESLTAELDGAVELAKVDCDQEPDLAQGHRVQGIPDVRLYSGGQEVGRFVGLRSKEQIQDFLAEHGAGAPLSPSAESLEQGQRLFAAGQLDEAMIALTAALESSEARSPEASSAHLTLARLHLARHELTEAQQHLESIPASAEESEAAEHLGETLKLVKAGREEGTDQELTARLEADPSDLAARFALGASALARGEHEEALKLFLAVVEADRRWRDEAGRKAMVTVFHLIGVRHPMADAYRDRLRRLLY
ncbi:MAG: tetratricopeptide repeat protein [Acidobacteriota bacterium]